MYPEDYLYSKDHEWLRIEGDIAYVGITDYAQQQLGEVVYVESVAVGRVLEANQEFGTVESVKSVSELYAPVAAEILEFNEALEDSPELINDDPHGEGWIVKIKILGEIQGLVNAKVYQEYIE
jgi:glycine cleavage system H protein